jgi:transcriptional regulator with GAF, ATPase, and Fis domain
MDYSSDLHALARLVAAPIATEEVLMRGLEGLGRVVPYDLAAVFRLEGGCARVFAAAGRLASPAVRGHAIELARFPTIARALELRRPIALQAHHHASTEGDPYDGVLDLPHGHSCMVVPLFAGDRDLGLITVDRQVCGSYASEVVELAGVYGQLMALSLHLSDLAGTLDRYRCQLSEHNRLLMEESRGGSDAATWLASSRDPAMRELVGYAKQVALSTLPVLVLGETGTGKEMVAHAIHAWSARSGGPFVKLNCSAIPDTLVESELFGHVRGAFSGADRSRPGRFVTANGGSLLLDEIGDMPLSAQANLLRVLQEGTFEPVGSDRSVKVDVRVIAATHVDLERAVREGRFREDLYYRLAVFPLNVPALRDRPSDVSNIARGFLEREHRRAGRGPWTLSDTAQSALMRQHWPGNVRELINTLERAILLHPRGTLEPKHLSLRADGRSPASSVRGVIAPLDGRLPSWKENERRYLEELTRDAQGRLYGPGGAAETAGLKPTTLRSKLLRHGLR